MPESDRGETKMAIVKIRLNSNGDADYSVSGQATEIGRAQAIAARAIEHDNISILLTQLANRLEEIGNQNDLALIAQAREYSAVTA